MDLSIQAIFRQAFPFWSKLSTHEQALLYNNTTTLSCHRGHNIHGNTNQCTGVILVRSGCLRAYMLSDQGRELTLYHLYPNDICMLSASCVLQSISFDVFVDACQDSEILIISSEAFASVIQSNVYAENFALKQATKKFSDVTAVMQHMLFTSFDRRLARFLWQEAVRTNSQSLHYTHEEIAGHLGTAREVVSRMLKQFAAEGIVSLSRGGIQIIDPSKLKKIVD